MIQNNNNIKLTEAKESAVKEFRAVIANIPGEDVFTISIGITEGVLGE